MIDLKLIDKREQRKIARTFLPLIEQFFENPENQRKFEKWEKETTKNK